MVPALDFNSIIVATDACRDNWNRHAVALSNIFLHRCHFLHFCKKNAKNEERLCPLPYEEVLEAIKN